MSRWIYKSYLPPVLCFFEIDLTEQMYKKSGPEPITAYRGSGPDSGCGSYDY